MHGKLEIAVNDEPDCRMIDASGEIDMESSPELLRLIKDGLTNLACVKINLKSVTYVDSSGIAVLIQGFKFARKESARFVLVDTSAQVMSVIELSQLKSFFEFEESGGEG